MVFTLQEKETPVPPNAGIEIQSFVGMLNSISWGVDLFYFKNQKKIQRIFLI